MPCAVRASRRAHPTSRRHLDCSPWFNPQAEVEEKLAEEREAAEKTKAAAQLKSITEAEAAKKEHRANRASRTRVGNSNLW